MTIPQIVVGSLMILASLVIIAIVLLQQGRRSGVGAISGGIDTFLSKNKARDWDSKLARMTKYVALVFFIIAVVANAIALVK